MKTSRRGWSQRRLPCGRWAHGGRGFFEVMRAQEEMLILQETQQGAERERGRHMVVFPPSSPSNFCHCLVLAKHTREAKDMGA